MLIRLANDDLVEYPDELGALVLADPSCGDVPDFSLEELNCVISGALGVMFDESLTLEQNIADAMAEYTQWGTPSAANMEKARRLIKYYKEKIALEDIGYSDRALLHAAYGIISPEQARRKIFNADGSDSGGKTTLLNDSASPDAKR
ncbi:hypothetical protein V8J88_04490 [Massilia sp. W12]|uniref:hypothetical protein n=1 Tax=Massilia sp. W12 TaxID=3126507 RepID=UPI0030D0D4FF